MMISFLYYTPETGRPHREDGNTNAKSQKAGKVDPQKEAIAKRVLPSVGAALPASPALVALAATAGASSRLRVLVGLRSQSGITEREITRY
jgi:hypothetical protein